MCLAVCFEAGRFTQTQSSRTASCRSRKWMSGPADPWTQSATDRKRQILQQFVRLTSTLQDALLSVGRRVFSLDKPLSWMSPLRPGVACHPFSRRVAPSCLVRSRFQSALCCGIAITLAFGLDISDLICA